jgi:glyoxylase I family protein
MRIEHIALNIPDTLTAVQWYCDHLGMQLVRGSQEPPYMNFVADSAGQGVIEFYSNTDAPMPDYAAMNPLVFHIAFVVDDIETARQRLLAAGAQPVNEIATTPAGDQLLFLRDPWGVPLQLVMRKKPLVG